MTDLNLPDFGHFLITFFVVQMKFQAHAFINESFGALTSAFGFNQRLLEFVFHSDPIVLLYSLQPFEETK